MRSCDVRAHTAPKHAITATRRLRLLSTSPDLRRLGWPPLSLHVIRPHAWQRPERFSYVLKGVDRAVDLEVPEPKRTADSDHKCPGKKGSEKDLKHRSPQRSVAIHLSYGKHEQSPTNSHGIGHMTVALTRTHAGSRRAPCWPSRPRGSRANRWLQRRP